MSRRHPLSSLTATLVPYTTLFPSRLRMAEIHAVQAETPPSTISRAGAMPSIAILAIVIVLFALAQNYAALHIEQAFQASSPKNLYGLALRGRPFFCT